MNSALYVIDVNVTKGNNCLQNAYLILNMQKYAYVR
jgi:hypothetical protein